jgi:hypothetical protein
MVGPMSDEERRASSQRLYAGFVALVGVSAGLMALSAGATILQTAAVVLGGTLLGVCLMWYLLQLG